MSSRQMWSAEHFKNMYIRFMYYIASMLMFIPKYTVYKFIFVSCYYYFAKTEICSDNNIQVLVQENRTKEKFSPTVLNLPIDDEGQKGLK